MVSLLLTCYLLPLLPSTTFHLPPLRPVFDLPSTPAAYHLPTLLPSAFCLLPSTFCLPPSPSAVCVLVYLLLTCPSIVYLRFSFFYRLPLLPTLPFTFTLTLPTYLPCISCSIFYLLPGTLYLYLVTLTSYLLPSLPPLPSYPLSFFLPSTFPLPSAIYLPSTFYLLLPLLPSLTFCLLPSAFYLLPSAIFTFYRLPVTFLTIFYLSPSALPLTCPTVVGNE